MASHYGGRWYIGQLHFYPGPEAPDSLRESLTPLHRAELVSMAASRRIRSRADGVYLERPHSSVDLLEGPIIECTMTRDRDAEGWQTRDEEGRPVPLEADLISTTPVIYWGRPDLQVVAVQHNILVWRCSGREFDRVMNGVRRILERAIELASEGLASVSAPEGGWKNVEVDVSWWKSMRTMEAFFAGAKRLRGFSMTLPPKNHDRERFSAVVKELKDALSLPGVAEIEFGAKGQDVEIPDEMLQSLGQLVKTDGAQLHATSSDEGKFDTRQMSEPEAIEMREGAERHELYSAIMEQADLNRTPNQPMKIPVDGPDGGR